MSCVIKLMKGYTFNSLRNILGPGIFESSGAMKNLKILHEEGADPYLINYQ